MIFSLHIYLSLFLFITQSISLFGFSHRIQLIHEIKNGQNHEQISAYPQDSDQSISKKNEIRELFKKIESAFDKFDIGTLSSYFSSKVYLNFFTGENGYFSSNQTYYILKKFFGEYKVISFSYSSTSLSTTNPYAIGHYQYVQRGLKGTAQIFISLHNTDQGFRINQITVSLKP